jgi:hypothetical protein
VRHAILTTVVDVKTDCPNSVVVLLASDELDRSTKVLSTGLNGEESRKTAEECLEVKCKGDPKAKTGDKVPVIICSKEKS